MSVTPPNERPTSGSDASASGSRSHICQRDSTSNVPSPEGDEVVGLLSISGDTLWERELSDSFAAIKNTGLSRSLPVHADNELPLENIPSSGNGADGAAQRQCGLFLIQAEVPNKIEQFVALLV